jgi:hypothetical protein
LIGHDTPGRRGKLISLSDLPFFMKALPKNVLCSTSFLGSSPMILRGSLYLQRDFLNKFNFVSKLKPFWIRSRFSSLISTRFFYKCNITEHLIKSNQIKTRIENRIVLFLLKMPELFFFPIRNLESNYIQSKKIRIKIGKIFFFK